MQSQMPTVAKYILSMLWRGLIGLSNKMSKSYYYIQVFLQLKITTKKEMHLLIDITFEKSSFTWLDKDNKIEPVVMKWQLLNFFTAILDKTH